MNKKSLKYQIISKDYRRRGKEDGMQERILILVLGNKDDFSILLRVWKAKFKTARFTTVEQTLPYMVNRTTATLKYGH